MAVGAEAEACESFGVVLSLGLTGETDPSLGAGRQQVRPWGARGESFS